ncbi:MAG: Mercuric reductase [Chlamydiae bacterium]|nr:Mercuric reductase [Chlamydiota bacterium]
MEVNIAIIGAGAAGLVVAIGAAKGGKKVLLIEKGQYGGDCTNFGCIPSKTLIASAKVAHSLRLGKKFGLGFEEVSFDASKALDRVRATIAGVRSHEEPEALEKMGVATLTGVASFIDPHTLSVKTEEKEVHVKAKKIVLACGSHPYIPPIDGLKEAPYLTNETIFDLQEIPGSLAILGAGPIGCELAQAMSRLGSMVTIIHSLRGLLPNEEPEVQEVMEAHFKKEGIVMHLGCAANQVSYENGRFSICIDDKGEHKTIEADHLLVATGRRVSIADLNLENAKVSYSEKGIPIDRYGRTSTPHIFAIGDVVGPPFFTHLAENQARSVLTTLLLPSLLKRKIDPQPTPRCTFTDPEVASFGLLEKEAAKKWSQTKVATYTLSLSEVDRAITMGRTEGFIKVVTKKWSSKILGATIVAPRAGEMLPELSLAALHHIPLRKLTRLIHPYPTYNGGIRKCADLWLTKTILPLFKRKPS